MCYSHLEPLSTGWDDGPLCVLGGGGGSALIHYLRQNISRHQDKAFSISDELFLIVSQQPKKPRDWTKHKTVGLCMQNELSLFSIKLVCLK